MLLWNLFGLMQFHICMYMYLRINKCLDMVVLHPTSVCDDHVLFMCLCVCVYGFSYLLHLMCPACSYEISLYAGVPSFWHLHDVGLKSTCPKYWCALIHIRRCSPSDRMTENDGIMTNCVTNVYISNPIEPPCSTSYMTCDIETCPIRLRNMCHLFFRLHKAAQSPEIAFRSFLAHSVFCSGSALGTVFLRS